jgi:Fic family protein
LFYYRIDQKGAGKWRKRPVFLSGSKYPLPQHKDIPYLIKDFCTWVSENRDKYHPVIFSAEVHRRFVFIHPFVDGNGRVSRLLMNLILLQNSFTIGIISPILRAEYINLLELAHKDVNPFNQFISERILETQRDYLRLLK